MGLAVGTIIVFRVRGFQCPSYFVDDFHVRTTQIAQYIDGVIKDTVGFFVRRHYRVAHFLTVPGRYAPAAAPAPAAAAAPAALAPVLTRASATAAAATAAPVCVTTAAGDGADAFVDAAAVGDVQTRQFAPLHSDVTRSFVARHQVAALDEPIDDQGGAVAERVEVARMESLASLSIRARISKRTRRRHEKLVACMVVRALLVHTESVETG